LGSTRGLAAALVVCAGTVGFAGCGSSDDEPPGATAGDVEPVGELAGSSVPLDEGAFDNILSLTVEAEGEGRTLVAGQLELARTGSTPDVRLVVDGKEERTAEARESAGGDQLVIACACELTKGEHEIEFQGRAVSGSVPIAARSLMALDGVEYATEPQDGSGPLPPAINAAVLDTSAVLVSGAATTLAQLDVTGTTSGDRTIVLAQIGSTRSTVDPSGIALTAGVNGQETSVLASQVAEETEIAAFGLEGPASPGARIDLLANVIGGGSTDLNLIALVSCPCGLETES
jgi:hypothetical protein